MPEEETYMVIRHFQDWRPSKVQKKGLTLEEAQAHVQDPENQGIGWSDVCEVEDH